MPYIQMLLNNTFYHCSNIMNPHQTALEVVVIWVHSVCNIGYQSTFISTWEGRLNLLWMAGKAVKCPNIWGCYIILNSSSHTYRHRWPRLKIFSLKLSLFSCPSIRICFWCSNEPYQWYGLLSTHNVCFSWEIIFWLRNKMIIFNYALVWFIGNDSFEPYLVCFSILNWHPFSIKGLEETTFL